MKRKLRDRDPEAQGGMKMKLRDRDPEWLPDGNSSEVEESRSEKIMKRYFARQPQVESFKREERLPLIIAVDDGNLSHVQKLVEQGDNINAKDECGETALHLACLKGHLPLVKFLIEHGSNVNAQENLSTDSPLHWACHWGHWDVAMLLIQKGANVKAKNCSKETPMHKACFHLDVADDDCSSLQQTNNAQLVDLVKLLIQKGANVNTKNKSGSSPFRHACSSGRLEFVELMIDNAADWNRRGAFDSAWNNGHLEIAKLLMQNCPEEDYDGWTTTMLRKAIDDRDLDKIKFLIQNGADANIRYKYNGDTALHRACGFLFDLEMAALLIANGADTNARDNHGGTPLHDSSSRANGVKLLMESGADVNVKDNYGNTPLHYACLDGNLQVVKLLVNGGAKVDAESKDGRTPLHFACKGNRLEVVWLLMCRYPWVAGISTVIRSWRDHSSHYLL